MFLRIRAASVTVLLAALLTATAAFAKGNFSFIVITGPDLKEELHVTDAKLTTDFFAFSDFSRGRVKAPSDPGRGYEITRYYVDGKREIVFDRLHYYPEAGVVYYDGIVNGSSGYDRKWYSAKPEVKPVFEKLLPAPVQPLEPAEKKQPVPSAPQAQPAAKGLSFLPVSIAVITAGLAILFAFAFWRRKASAQ